MASSVVIKVKYEDTLRRFNAAVFGDNMLDLTMDELRVKICSLFSFPADADFTLTYIDEDNDQVTLAENEDLHDVVRQGLNPVRITVHLSKEKNASFSAKSSGTSTPASLQNLGQNINPNVVEGLKSVPEPVRDALSKLSHDLASRAASIAPPELAELINDLSKLGQSYLNAANLSHTGQVGDNRQSEKLETSVDKGTKSNGTGAVVADSAINGAESIAPPSLPSFMCNKVKDATKKKDKGIIGDCSKSGVNAHEHLQEHQEKHPSYAKEASEASHGKNRGSKYGGNSSTTTTFDSPLMGECPFLGVPLEPQPPPRRYKGFNGSHYNNVNGSYYNADGMATIFHKGVRCDGCGILPIDGPRFKSRVKHNYDLCSICFAAMGNDADYTRIDCPLPYRHSSKGFPAPMVHRLHPMKVPSLLRPCSVKHFRPRLDSRFIMDVNVMDGTLMAPSTPFTKIWRMRNNGTLPWSQGLQLLWIGGDRFSASDSVAVEVPLEGVKAGNEVDIAVDFIAPELPGRYISYWRMAEPSGHKFGQRVWVLIQVDASLSDSTYENSPTLNLNMPPEVSGPVVPPVLDVNAEPSLDVEAGDDLNSSPKAEKSSVGKQIRRVEIEDLNFPINDDLLVPTTGTASSSVSPVGSNNPFFPATSSISYPEVDVNASYKIPASAPPSPSLYPVISSAPPSPSLYPVINTSNESSSSSSSSTVGGDKKSPQQDDNGEIEVEESMLKELAEMGFKQVDLNKEVLRMNEYDMERSVDELCGVSEWDPILEDLQEMGFHDKDTNKKLLAKNNGSIMRVVMDLIAGEKP